MVDGRAVNLENILLQKRQAYRFQNDHYNAATKFDDLTPQNSNQFVRRTLNFSGEVATASGSVISYVLDT